MIELSQEAGFTAEERAAIERLTQRAQTLSEMGFAGDASSLAMSAGVEEMLVHVYQLAALFRDGPLPSMSLLLIGMLLSWRTTLAENDQHAVEAFDRLLTVSLQLHLPHILAGSVRPLPPLN